MSKLSFRARALDASKPMPIYLAEELPDLPDYSAINRAVPQMPSGMEKEEESYWAEKKCALKKQSALLNASARRTGGGVDHGLPHLSPLDKRLVAIMGGLEFASGDSGLAINPFPNPEHHLQRAISGSGLIIPTPEVCEVTDLEFYERCYPPDYKMPKQHIHMQPLWEEQEAPEYDIDSEDERWLKQQRHPELTELKFEQMMDKLEKSSGQTVVTLNEAKLLLERHDDLVIAVYDYWLNKRLNTQHPLVLSVKTESRPGQSSNNPYLAFRRRTEKMQTRKNRKNDESSYEKMLKLRRDLVRALTLLELVARRERAKRDLVRLTALLAERRYAVGDFANHLPDPPPRAQFTSASSAGLSSATCFRRETYAVQHAYPPRAPLTPVDQPRQREKRPYKRRKHRHHAAGSAQGLRDSGVCTSSEEEGGRGETATPPDDGPFSFRRKPGCYYEMPTSTLCGDPVDPDNPTTEGVFEHELDERHRFTLTSLNTPYTRCIGMCRRRVTRGGRVALDRLPTPLDALWPRLPPAHHNSQRDSRLREEVDLETKPHRTPKEISYDYHGGGKYPWRHAFRKHLAKNPELWLQPEALKPEPDLKPELKQEPEDKVLDDVMGEVKSDVKSDSIRTIDSAVRENLARVIRKRSWSGCSDSSYDSDESLRPVEREFEDFINEVNKEWLHFRPKTPPPSPPHDTPPDDQFPLALDTPITVELRLDPPSGVLDTFTTTEFTLADLYDVNPDVDNSGSSLDISGEDLLTENFTGLTEAQVESILSDTDLKALTEDDKKIPDLLDVLNDEKDSFLSQGQSSEGRAGSGRTRSRVSAAAAVSFGCTAVSVRSDRQPIYIDAPRPPAPVEPVAPKEMKAVKESKDVKEKPAPVPASRVIVEEVNDLPPIKVEKKRKEEKETVEEVQLGHGVQLKTVQTKHSPLKKHIITSTGHRRSGDVTIVTSETPQPQIVTVAVSDSLKVRLGGQAVGVSAGAGAGGVGVGGVSAGGAGLLANGPFAAVAVPLHQRHKHAAHALRDIGSPTVSSVASVVTAGTGKVGNATNVANIASVANVASVATVASVANVANVSGGRRVGAPLVQLAPASLAHKPLQLHHHPSVVVAPQVHHVAPNRLKVLHAHPLTHSQRAQLLAQNRSLAQLPAVVSLAALGDSNKPQAALLKAAPGSVAQFFEIKGGQLGKGPHLVNVLRQPPPVKTSVTRLDINDAKKRQVVFDGTLKGNVAAAPRHRVSVSLDGRQIVRAALPAVRAPHVRHQIQLKNRTVQVAAPLARTSSEPSTSITIAPTKTASIPSSVVANLLQKNVQLPKGQKIAISGPGGQALSANVQAIAITTAQLKARQGRLIAQPRPTPVAEIVEASTAPVPTSSASISSEAPLEDGEENGVRRRPTDTLPMEVT